jgi:twitching motility two-component system response regulator PilG
MVKPMRRGGAVIAGGCFRQAPAACCRCAAGSAKNPAVARRLLDSLEGQAVHNEDGVAGTAWLGADTPLCFGAHITWYGCCILGIESASDGLSGNGVDPNSNTQLAGLKVMVIDDSKTIRRTAETLLKKEGCEVLTAIDGFEALAKISDQKPAIIFVDIMMPRLDGYQTCALIKNNPQFRATPVIMLSSKDGLFDKARGRIVGAEQYLTKPFTREELFGAIRRHVIAVAA